MRTLQGIELHALCLLCAEPGCMHEPDFLLSNDAAVDGAALHIACLVLHHLGMLSHDAILRHVEL